MRTGFSLIIRNSDDANYDVTFLGLLHMTRELRATRDNRDMALVAEKDGTPSNRAARVAKVSCLRAAANYTSTYPYWLSSLGK